MDLKKIPSGDLSERRIGLPGTLLLAGIMALSSIDDNKSSIRNSQMEEKRAYETISEYTLEPIVVQKEDNLTKLVRARVPVEQQKDISDLVDALKCINRLNENSTIYPGQTINIIAYAPR